MSITAANSVYLLSINGLFNVPLPLQGYDADDAFDTESVDSTEVKIGVDGQLSAGFVFALVKQTISIQADSPSIEIFEQWYAAQKLAREIFFASGTIILPALNKSYSLTNGVLSTYSPLSDAKRVMQARKFGITWQSADPTPI